jgi:cytidylate kinase
VILALTGPSLSGKTTLAHDLARRFDLPLRVCGDDVRRAAAESRVDLSEVPDEVHRGIDRATREWAQESQPCIVDGRFLEYVLGPPTADVLLVRLEAGEAERQARSAKRGVPEAELRPVGQEDFADTQLVARLYVGVEPAKSRLTLDTGGLTPDTCLEILRPLLTSLLLA